MMGSKGSSEDLLLVV